jgi:NAD(P)H dehydrogenase (quinone)
MIRNRVRGSTVARLLASSSGDNRWRLSMAVKVLVLYYSSYGHMEKMAYAAAEGARKSAAEVSVKRVPETVPEDIARKSHFKLDQPAPVATIDELKSYDAIIVGIPTRFGRMSAQMTTFWDQGGGLWANGALVGKVGSVMSSSATQHGGQETTLFAGITQLLHFGLVIVGLPYSFAGQMTLDEITGGSPYGASTIAGSQGQRQPSENELNAARFQGELVGRTTAALVAGRAATNM